MGEDRVRQRAGREAGASVHRVGLTRRCLASGSIQLPFVLQGSLPEGELSALDVDRDEPVVLQSTPPRRLSGLRPFFEAYELQVNDLLEIRLVRGELRLAHARRARRAGGDVRDDARTSPVTPAAAPPAAAEPAPPEDDSDAVVDRLGSVTVRRLGVGRFASPPEAVPRQESTPGARAAAEAGTVSAVIGEEDLLDEPEVRPAQREREEALSRAGDLRSRVVRWLLDPATPVIVKHERVRRHFDLSAEVARDVLGGIVEDPPPSLRLAVLREGMVRVSRVTVEQEQEA